MATAASSRHTMSQLAVAAFINAKELLFA